MRGWSRSRPGPGDPAVPYSQDHPFLDLDERDDLGYSHSHGLEPEHTHLGVYAMEAGLQDLIDTLVHEDLHAALDGVGEWEASDRLDPPSFLRLVWWGLRGCRTLVSVPGRDFEGLMASPRGKPVLVDFR